MIPHSPTNHIKSATCHMAASLGSSWYLPWCLQARATTFFTNTTYRHQQARRKSKNWERPESVLLKAASVRKTHVRNRRRKRRWRSCVITSKRKNPRGELRSEKRWRRRWRRNGRKSNRGLATSREIQIARRQSNKVCAKAELCLSLFLWIIKWFSSFWRILDYLISEVGKMMD